MKHNLPALAAIIILFYSCSKKGEARESRDALRQDPVTNINFINHISDDPYIIGFSYNGEGGAGYQIESPLRVTYPE